MATVTLIQLLASGVVDSTGAPIASGKARAYQPGTLTPETIYADNAGATPIVQPLTLTAGGTGIAYFSNPIRLILKDSTDTSTLLDVNIVGGSPASTFVTSTSFNGGVQTTLQAILDAVDDSFGGTDWKYKHSATASERTIKAWMSENQVSVVDYGAVGDDSTNNLTAIQNAITAAGTGVLYFPPGTFRFNGALSIPAGGIRIMGAGRSATTLKQMSTTTHGFDITSSATTAVTYFEDLSLVLNAASSGAAIRSAFSGTNRTLIRCREVTIGSTTARWTNAILDQATSPEVYCINCSMFSSGDSISSLGNGGVWLSNTSVSSSTAKGVTGFGSYYLTGSSISGSTMGVDAGTNLFAASCVISGGTSVSSGAIYVAGTDTSTVTDTRTGSPVAFVLSGTTSVTPLPAQSAITKIVQGGAGATTTINAPAAALFGLYHTIICSNTSGGALTWTFNAAFKTSAAVAPATGNRISVLFYYDAVDAKWSEIARSAAVPN